MDYKTLIIKHVYLSLFLLIGHFVNGQNCLIEKVSVKPFYFNGNGLLSAKYESMKVIDSNNYQVMLINFLSYSNQKKCYYLSIDSNKKYSIEVVTPDSILFSGCINTTNKYNSKTVTNNSGLNGFFISECSNILSSHTKQVLVICNNSLNIWIEYISMDGHMKETLKTNRNYSYLIEVYELAEKVFKDLQLYTE